MNYSKGLALCGVVLAVSAAIMAAATPLDARSRPIIVTGPPSDTVTRRVSYRDLNLASLQGERTLIHRVRGAVAEVCWEASPWNRMRQCRSETWQETRPQITRAVARAHEFAATGYSSIPPVAISIVFPK
jgi:UrcA family protein